MAQSYPDLSAPPASATTPPNTVTRADLVEAVQRQTGLPRADCARYVEMVLDEVFEAIVTRQEVRLSSFGAFQIRAKRERQGRNPKTGQGAKITARLVVTFKPSNVMRARVNTHFKVPAPRKSNGARKANGDGRHGDGAPPKGDGAQTLTSFPIERTERELGATR